MSRELCEAAGVIGDQVSVDDLRELPLEAPEGFAGALSLGELAAIVILRGTQTPDRTSSSEIVLMDTPAQHVVRSNASRPPRGPRLRGARGEEGGGSPRCCCALWAQCSGTERSGGDDMASRPAPGSSRGSRLPARGCGRSTRPHLRGSCPVPQWVTEVRGHFGEFSGAVHVAERPAKSSVELVIKASRINTGNDDRGQAPSLRRFSRRGAVSRDPVQEHERGAHR